MKNILHFLYLSLCFVCFAPLLRASDINYETIRLERRLTAVKITDKITVDGKLDEPAWADASRAFEFIQKEPNEGEPASEKTEITT